MKFIYSFFTILLFSSFLFSQNLPKGYALGYYFDEKEQFIGGYADADYKAYRSFKVSYTAGSDFEDGCYYDHQNVKHAGLILQVKGDTKIRFKANRNAEVTTIQAKNSNGFVVGRDSFVVLVNNSKSKSVDYDDVSESNKCFFALVVGQTANNTFYRHPVNSDGSYRYSVSDAGKGGYELFPKKDDAFKQMAAIYLGGYSVLASKIRAGKYTAYDIPNMVKLANYQDCYRNKDSIYFNQAWNEVKHIAIADKYCLVDELLSDSVFVVKHYFLDGTPISKVQVTSFFPYKTIGTSEYYFPNGNVRKRRSPMGKQALTTYFYDNGAPMFDIVTKEKSLLTELDRIMSSNAFVNQHYIGSMNYQQVKDRLEGQDDANGITSQSNKSVFASVFDAKGVSVLDVSGKGSVDVVDDIRNRTISYSFENNKPANVYYTDSNGRRVYQLCDKPAKMLVDKLSLLKNLPDLLNYQAYHFNPDARGVTLVRFVVEPTGLVSEYEIIKSAGADYDNQISNFFKYTTMYATFSPAVVEKIKVPQEVVMPFVFELITHRPSGNYHSQYWMMQNMMWQQQMMMQSMPKTGPVMPRF
jgi:hypothetical protein